MHPGQSEPKTEPGLDLTIAATGGMTSRVAQGSLWVLGGQVLTLLGSAVTTPFVIRALGAQQYGLLALVNLLTGYLAFSDLGMGIASTKFGAEAHGRRDPAQESAVVWTSLLIACGPVAVAAAILILGGRAVLSGVFHVPQNLLRTGGEALALAAVIVAATALSGVLNTPQLARLRLDLNVRIVASSAVCGAVLILTVLAFDGGLLPIVAAMAVVACGAALLHFAVSARLLPELLRGPRLDARLLRPMMVFGAGILGISALGTFIVHGEKFLLVRLASVESLAYYNVAATLAGLLSQVPAALAQPLMPSFVHLQQSGNREALERLYRGAVKTVLLWILPAGFVVCVCAPILIRVWAGEAYVEQSIAPLYILALGWVFGGILYVPKGLLSAWGRPGLVARYQACELLPYVVLMFILIRQFGAPGAALAWSIRSAFELWLMIRAVRRCGRVEPALERLMGLDFAAAVAALLLPVCLVRLCTHSQAALAAALAPALALYAAVAARRLLSEEERTWLTGLFARLYRK